MRRLFFFASVWCVLLIPDVALGSRIDDLLAQLDSGSSSEQRRAIPALEEIAQSENPGVYSLLAFYSEQVRDPPDLEAAERYLRLWAAAPSEDGHIALAGFYLRNGRDEDFYQTFLAANDQFQSDSVKLGLATAYMQGIGVPRNDGAALELLFDLYQKGSVWIPPCQGCDRVDIRERIADLLLRESSAAFDPKAARKFAELSAEDGNVYGLYRWASVVSQRSASDSDEYLQAVRIFESRLDEFFDQGLTYPAFFLASHYFNVARTPASAYEIVVSALGKEGLSRSDRAGLLYIEGLLVSSGRGTDADSDNGLALILESSELGDPDARALIAELTTESIDPNDNRGCLHSCSFIAEIKRIKKDFASLPKEPTQQEIVPTRKTAPARSTAPARTSKNSGRAREFFGQLLKFAGQVLAGAVTVLIEIVESDPYAVGYLLGGGGLPPSAGTSFGFAASRANGSNPGSANGTWLDQQRDLSSTGRKNSRVECRLSTQCGIGSVCVKRMYSGEGICLRGHRRRSRWPGARSSPSPARLDSTSPDTMK